MPDLRQSDRGFTLIELLVVVVIIGILSVSVAFSISGNAHRSTLREAHRLATLLEMAVAETQSGKRRLAWSARPDGYDFLTAESRSAGGTLRWTPLADDPIFRPRKLTEETRIMGVEIDHQPLPSGSLLVFGRGDPPLFRITLQSAEAGIQAQSAAQTIELRGLPTGQISVLSGEAD